MGDCVHGVGVDGGHARDFDLLNTMLGYDAAGEIVEIDPAVEGFEVGQKVLTFVRMGQTIKVSLLPYPPVPSHLLLLPPYTLFTRYGLIFLAP